MSEENNSGTLGPEEPGVLLPPTPPTQVAKGAIAVPVVKTSVTDGELAAPASKTQVAKGAVANPVVLTRVQHPGMGKLEVSTQQPEE